MQRIAIPSWNNYCLPLKAFGPIDDRAKIPRTLAIIIQKLVKNLNGIEWLAIIQTTMRSGPLTASQIKAVLDKSHANEELTTKEMLMAVAQIFLNDNGCYSQYSLAYRFGLDTHLDAPRKFSNAEEMFHLEIINLNRFFLLRFASVESHNVECIYERCETITIHPKCDGGQRV